MNGRWASDGGAGGAGSGGAVEALLAGTDSLNTSARLSMWILERGEQRAPSAVIQALMKAHGWTCLRAWRHWGGYSRAEVARRLGVHLASYELIEDGTVDLGCWLQPAVELLLLD
ncbi:hypothetical protein [Achromobacter spanius]|uniref:hypothetical protein n=1 Tax=Achromobacter spanius TaxID=217203 RepID=UPI0037FA9A41